ncbi:O-antigen ligase [Bifidobacterium sp. ESL0784]|uniref:O-antigen polymerase n=1 Tax=Bifidobacterium sp. ESL0784 TaxID=2983231 RepID=UPI0023F9F3FE|nr:O-antigen polymerase [Bifidobacterium sp. ESL0784]MDF7640327.1 O-antigen ligase [Bifidobacterium sp. ESL0784]
MVLAYIGISLLLLPASYWVCKRWINPLSIYVVVWLAVVLLYQLRLSELQDVPADKTYVVLLAALCFFALFFVIFRFIPTLSVGPKEGERRSVTHTQIVFLSLAWLFAEIIEIVYSKGLPIVWLLTGSSKTYFDYGIPTFHGLFNSVALVTILLAEYELFTAQKHNIWRDDAIIIGAILLFYVCLISRQMIVSAAVELLVVLAFLKPKWTKRLLLPLILVGILLFGVIGNFRTSNFNVVSRFKTTPIGFLSGFYWVYMYVTMTLANINRLVGLPPLHLGFPLISQYLPSVLRPRVSREAAYQLFNSGALVSSNFTASGYFSVFYAAYGVLGVLIIAGLYGAVSGWSSHILMNTRDERSILVFAVVIQVIILSFFDNFLLYLPDVFQLLILLYLFRKKRVQPSSEYAD